MAESRRREASTAGRLVGMRRRRLLLPCVALCALAAAPPEPAGAAPDAPWLFDLRIAPAADLSTMTVSMTFRGDAPKRLVLDDGAGAVWIAPGPGGGGLAASPAGGYAAAGPSVSYVVDLERLQREKDGAAYRVGRDLVTRVGRWLLR